MKKLLVLVMAVVLVMGTVYYPASAKGGEGTKPVIGIAWRADIDSEFYTNICDALDEIGVEHVLLGQVKSADLKYDDNGKLKKGVAKTGALSKSAGKLVRCNSWHDSNAADVVSAVDAVIFTGGEDISPSLYYKQVKWHGIEAERDFNAERDVSDYLLMSYCLDMDIPVMGFCRGMQMLGVLSGAEVIQDIPTYFDQLGLEYNYEHRNEKTSPEQYRDYAPHAIRVSKNSLLYGIVGAKRLSGCPSWHHQALLNVDNTRLKVTGTVTVSGIKMIEAIERTDKTYALGVQFHPEAAVVKNINKADNADKFMSKDKALEFFTYFVEVISEKDGDENTKEDEKAA